MHPKAGALGQVKTEKGFNVTGKKMADTAMHTICDRTHPPATMEPCAAANFRLAISVACAAARKKIADKYYNGKMDAAHQKQYNDVKKRIESDRRSVKNICRK